MAPYARSLTLPLIQPHVSCSTPVHAEPREMLSMSASFDHDVVDGAPATRFLHRFNQMCVKLHDLEQYAPEKR